MSEISFPLKARQFVQILSGGKTLFLEVTAQSQPKVYTAPYLILPGSSITDQIPQIGNLNIFDVNSDELVQWVTWIDNKNLGVTWKINGQEQNLLQGISSPLTHEISPKGNSAAPFFLYNQPRANVTYSLVNLSQELPIRGTLEVILYSFSVKPVTTTPSVYTVAGYSLSQAV
jgi:hypothetical protein